MPFFFRPFRIAADRKKETDSSSSNILDLTACLSSAEKGSDVTWRKLHLSEAFDGKGDCVSIDQDVKLLSDTFMPGFWHIQDVARSIPA